MSKRTKWSIATILVLLVGGVIVLGAAKRGNKATDVREEKVQKRDLVASVTASGQVQPRVKVDVASDVSGRIVRLSVKEGQMVKKGQFLLQIDPSTYEAEVQRSQAAVASARAGGSPHLGPRTVRVRRGRSSNCRRRRSSRVRSPLRTSG